MHIKEFVDKAIADGVLSKNEQVKRLREWIESGTLKGE